MTLLVFVPSAGRGAGDFTDVCARLVARGFDVLCPEPRGHGLRLSYLDWAADLAAVIKASPHDRAVLIGHAAGSRYARVCAAEFPQLVRGVVVAAAAALEAPEHLRVHLICAADSRRPVEARLEALRRAFFAPGRDASVWLTGWSREVLQAQHASTPTQHWWTGGQAPMLDMIGEHDAWRPPDTRAELRTLLGDRVSTVVVPGAGHALFPENPAAVADAIADWVRRLDNL